MKNFRILICLSVLFTFSCRATSNEWSCRNLDSKVGCASISKADDAYLENGKFSSATTSSTKRTSSKAKYSSFEDVNLGQTRLVRVPEKIGRIWVAPYTDGNGNYHEASFIRVVDAESKWERVAENSDLKSSDNTNPQTDKKQLENEPEISEEIDLSQFKNVQKK
jgi:hypothetical protein